MRFRWVRRSYHYYMGVAVLANVAGEIPDDDRAGIGVGPDPGDPRCQSSTLREQHPRSSPSHLRDHLVDGTNHDVWSIQLQPVAATRHNLNGASGIMITRV